MEPTDLLDRIGRWCRVAPSRLAHISGDRRLTYAELWLRSDALAEHLVRLTADDRSPVAVMGQKEPELLIAFLGAAKAGRPYVPIDTVQPAHRVQRIIELSGARLMLTADDVPAVPDASGRPPARQLDSHDPFYIMFTSGSTGEPKGVVITRSNLMSFLEWMLAEQAPDEGEVFLNQVPYSFDVSVMDTYLALITGGTVVSISRADVANPKRLYHLLGRSGITTWVSTPSFAQVCLAEPSFDRAMLPRVRRFLFCGETLPSAVAEQLLTRFPEAAVWNTYGPTEATVATTSIRIDRPLLDQYSPLPIGYPMPGTDVVIVDEAGEAVAEGVRGEILIAGPNVSPGYLNRPDLTARAFLIRHGRWAYRTGDWGRRHDGLLFCEGRMDDQVKLHGYRIELGDVEANLRALPDVQDAVVVPTARGGQPDGLCAFIILRMPQTGSDFAVSNALRMALVERLPAYMLPRQMRFLQAFPMTVNGKADRHKLRELLA